MQTFWVYCEGRPVAVVRLPATATGEEVKRRALYENLLIGGTAEAAPYLLRACIMAGTVYTSREALRVYGVR